MIEEEKKLLLKSLCETAQYGVKGLALGKKTDTIKTICLSEYPFIVTNSGLTCHVGKQFKPYLRPTSSMTEEERKEYESFIFVHYHEWDGYGTSTRYVEDVEAKQYIDWLNAHHFDFRGLIEKGLALEAPEGMYKV